MQSRVSLAELIDADIPVRPDEAVAILRDVCQQYAAGELHGIPNPTVIRLAVDGRILVEGPVNRDQHPVHAAAALLNELLPGFDGPNGFKVPGGLRLVLARATRALDLPPFDDVGEFCAALERFAAADAGETVRGLFRAWSARQAVGANAERPHEITISDVRRARRATGLSLEDVAQASAIPAVKLRELEWGYMRAWSADARGRDELRRYARASGLDEDMVISVAWPLIESGEAPEPACDTASPASATWALVPAHSDVPVPLPWPSPKARIATMTGHRWAFAMAAAVLLVATVFVGGWERSARGESVAGMPAAVTHTDASTDSAQRATPPALRGDVRPASLVRPVTARPRPPQKAKSRPAPPQQESFFKRELLRIVIR